VTLEALKSGKRPLAFFRQCSHPFYENGAFCA
jgi:hypothetical protein